MECDERESGGERGEDFFGGGGGGNEVKGGR